MMSVYFSDNAEAAFSVNAFLQAIGYTISFVSGTFVNLQMRLFLVLFFLLLANGATFWLDMVQSIDVYKNDSVDNLVINEEENEKKPFIIEGRDTFEDN